MNSRERINSIMMGKGADRCGLWLGNPHPETVEIYLKALGLKEKSQLFDYFYDDCRWLVADAYYKHPAEKPVWDLYKHKKSLATGFFLSCNAVEQLDSFDWPKAEYFDFKFLKSEAEKYSDKAVFSGMWTCFFHVLCDLFGMEEYFIKMHTHPKLVEAATEIVVEFYLESNKKVFEEGGEFDIFFMGNDLGSQLDLLMSPEMFKKFVLPGLRRNVELAKKYNKKVMLHSCGSIYRIIDDLIEIGVDAIHPLQAHAKDMDAVTLAKKFKGRIAFVGAVDTQDLLVNAKPDRIKDEVNRLKDLLGPNLIISPSHEAILPDVPMANIEAMVSATLEN